MFELIDTGLKREDYSKAGILSTAMYKDCSSKSWECELREKF